MHASGNLVSCRLQNKHKVLIMSNEYTKDEYENGSSETSEKKNCNVVKFRKFNFIESTDLLEEVLNPTNEQILTAMKWLLEE